MYAPDADVPERAWKKPKHKKLWRTLTDPSIGKYLQFSGIWVEIYESYQTTET